MKDKLFLLFIFLSGLLICGEYAVTRPVSNSLFLTLFSASYFPWVWLATVPVNLGVIYLYNRFLPKLGPLRWVWIFALFSIFMNGLTALYYERFPALLFLQFIWKDLYILLMLKSLWSMIHSTLPTTGSKYLYNCIYGMGTVGGILGSFIPGYLAPLIGSEKILFFTAPIYALVLLCYTQAFRRSSIALQAFQQIDPSPKEAFSLIRRSSGLIAVLFLVIFMQASVALMEYQFNAHLELNILEKDLRTAYYGKIMGMVNVLGLILQFLGGLFLMRFMGLQKSHLLVPLLLGSSAIAAFFVPSFAVLSCSYVFLRGLEFSLFGALREMLYVSMPLDAKYRAKAVIDVFAYRTSRAFIALSLLALQGIAGAFLLPAAGFTSILLFIVWFVTIAFFFKKQVLA